MAQYFTDFSEYTTGVQPSDWTRRFAANFSWTVESDAGATGGKVLQSPLESDSDRNGLSWDEIDADANRDNVEILAKVRFISDLNNTELLMMARGSGSAAAANSYRHGPRPVVGDLLQASLYDGGTFVSMAEVETFSYVLDTWYWVRVRINGSTHQVRLWEDGSSEPGTWDIDTTDSTITGVGWVGLLRFRPEAADIDVFGVGTDGDTAPTSPVSAGPTGPFLRTTGGYLRTASGILRPA